VKRILTVLMLLAILLAVSGPTQAESTVDGFVGLPWGSTAKQIAKAMQEKGFPPDNSTITDYYNGEFSGYYAHLYFDRKNDALVGGRVALCRSPYSGGPSVVHECAHNMANVLAERYGPPTGRLPGYKTEDFSLLWEPLRSSASSKNVSGDVISVSLQVIYPSNTTDGLVLITFKNISLEKRIIVPVTP
jgi:hypothetical protein